MDWGRIAADFEPVTLTMENSPEAVIFRYSPDERGSNG
jgi:hypothetical protein